VILTTVVTPSLAHRARQRGAVRDVLHGNRIWHVHFGMGLGRVVRGIDRMLGRGPNVPYHVVQACGADHAIGWPGLVVFFQHGRFVGYSYRPAAGDRREPMLATARGLRVGDTLKVGKFLYGSAFHDSAEHGGSWWATTPGGRVEGLVSGWPGGPRGSVATIAAGELACPTVSQ
jgi:hypothetical protein